MAGAASRAATNAAVPPPVSAAISALLAAWPDARILITINTIVVATATPSRSHFTLTRPGAGVCSAPDGATAVSDRVASEATSLLARRRCGGRGANRGGLTLGAPTAASSGCVTVAAKARLRAAAQSAQILAPGGHSLAQIRHFIRPFSSGWRPGPPVTDGVFSLSG